MPSFEQGMFDALLETWVELEITDDWKEQMVERTIIRARAIGHTL